MGAEIANGIHVHLTFHGMFNETFIYKRMYHKDLQSETRSKIYLSNQKLWFNEICIYRPFRSYFSKQNGGKFKILHIISFDQINVFLNFSRFRDP